MPTYTVKDDVTGKTITFEWSGKKPPTQNDMQDIFSQARKQAPAKPGNYPVMTTRESFGGEDPYAGEKVQTGTTWMPEQVGGIPRWGLQNPALWGARGAGLSLYDAAVQPTLETLGMIGGSTGSPVVGTALGYGAGKKVGEMGRGYLERIGMPEELQRPQRGVVEELGRSAVDVAQPLVMGAAFNKAAKMIQPIDDAITAVVKKGIDKGIRPTVVGKKLPGQAERYYENAETAVKTILQNKDKLQLTTPFGEIAKKQIPQDLRQFQQAITQTKEIIFKEYDALRKAAGEAGVKVSMESTVRALQQFVDDPAIKTFSPNTYEYAKGLIEKLTTRAKGTGMTGKPTIAYKEFTPEQVQNAIKSYNASLKAFYKNPSYNTAKKAYVDSIIVNNLRKSIDDQITGATGQSYQALKNKYGALKSLEEEVGHRLVIDNRKNPKGLLDFSDVFTGYHAIRGILTLDPATITASGGGKALAWLYKRGNMPNTQIKKMFNTVDKLTQKRGYIEESTIEVPVKEVVKQQPYSTKPRVPVGSQEMKFESGKLTKMGETKQRVPVTKEGPESYKIVPEHGTGMTKKVKKKLATKPDYVANPAIKVGGKVYEGDYAKGGHTEIISRIDKDPRAKALFDAGKYQEGGVTYKGKFVQRKSDVDFSEIKGRNVEDILDKIVKEN